MAETITWGLIASERPANTDEAALYLAGATEECNGVLRVCNQDSTERTYSIAHCAVTGVAAGKDWLAFETKISAKKTKEWSIHLGNNQELRRQTNVTDKMSFHYSGEKKVTT